MVPLKSIFVGENFHEGGGGGGGSELRQTGLWSGSVSDALACRRSIACLGGGAAYKISCGVNVKTKDWMKNKWRYQVFFRRQLST